MDLHLFCEIDVRSVLACQPGFLNNFVSFLKDEAECHFRVN